MVGDEGSELKPVDREVPQDPVFHGSAGARGYQYRLLRLPSPLAGNLPHFKGHPHPPVVVRGPGQHFDVCYGARVTFPPGEGHPTRLPA